MMGCCPCWFWRDAIVVACLSSPPTLQEASIPTECQDAHQNTDTTNDYLTISEHDPWPRYWAIDGHSIAHQNPQGEPFPPGISRLRQVAVGCIESLPSSLLTMWPLPPLHCASPCLPVNQHFALLAANVAAWVVAGMPSGTKQRRVVELLTFNPNGQVQLIGSENSSLLDVPCASLCMSLESTH